LYLIGINHDDGWQPASSGFDARLLQKLPPLNSHVPWTAPLLKLRTRLRAERLSIYDYRKVAHSLLRREQADCVEFPCAIPNWDNTPRSGYNGLVMTHSDPGLFRHLLASALEKCRGYPAEERIVFIKSWNEWAEGNYLEPDREFGHGYLEATRSALQDYATRADEQQSEDQPAPRTARQAA
jgi:hypothetical protein